MLIHAAIMRGFSRVPGIASQRANRTVGSQTGTAHSGTIIRHPFGAEKEAFKLPIQSVGAFWTGTFWTGTARAGLTHAEAAEDPATT